MKRSIPFLILLIAAVLFLSARVGRSGSYVDRNGDGMPDNMPAPSCDLVPYGVPQYACDDGTVSVGNVVNKLMEWAR